MVSAPRPAPHKSLVGISTPVARMVQDYPLAAARYNGVRRFTQSSAPPAMELSVKVRAAFPNLRVALLSAAFLTFATVMGEFTFASLLVKPAFGPYMQLLASSKVYEPSAIAVMSFLLTWICTGIIQLLGRRAPGQAPMAGVR